MCMRVCVCMCVCVRVCCASVCVCACVCCASVCVCACVLCECVCASVCVYQWCKNQVPATGECSRSGHGAQQAVVQTRDTMQRGQIPQAASPLSSHTLPSNHELCCVSTALAAGSAAVCACYIHSHAALPRTHTSGKAHRNAHSVTIQGSLTLRGLNSQKLTP